MSKTLVTAMIVCRQFEIRLCPALQKKPKLPTPQFDDQSGTDTTSKGDLANGRSKPDPFAPPYIQNLLIGELKDEDEGVEYVILVSPHFRSERCRAKPQRQ